MADSLDWMVNIAAQVNGTSKISDLQSKVSGADNAVTKLNKHFKDVSSSTDSTRESVEGAAKGFKKFGGPLKGVADFVEDASEGWTSLTESLGSSGALASVAAIGLVAVAAAVAALTIAIVAGTIALLKWAIGLADQRRELDLTLQALSGTEQGAKQLGAAFTDVQNATGLSSDRLVAITRDLKKANVAASDIPLALKAIATQEAALGDSSGTAELIKNLETGQSSAQDLAKTMDSKFGGIVEKRMLGINAQTDRFQRNLADVFGGLNIESFLEGLSKIVALFDTSTESGKALKTLFEALFQPLLDQSPAIFTMLERIFLLIEIKLLEGAILVQKFGKKWDEVKGPIGEIAEMLSPIPLDLLPLPGLLDLMLSPLYSIVLVLDLMISNFKLLAAIVRTPFDIISAAGDALPGKFTDIGNAIIDGLVNALTGGGGRVIGAVTGLADSAIGSAKKALKIASPSQVFEEIGDQTVAGFVGGVEGGAPSAASSLDMMTTSPSVQKATGASSSKSIEGNTFIFHGVKDAEDAEDRLIDALHEELGGETLAEVPAT